jgi:hypothetical protein
LLNVGAGERSRTPDLRITNALLYLLSYTGIKRRIIEFRRCGLKARTGEKHAALNHANAASRSAL